MSRGGVILNFAPPIVTTHSGRWNAAGSGGRGNTLTVDQRLYLVPFDILVASVAFDRIGVEVTGAGSAGSLVRVGIYADDGTDEPGALVLDAGTVASATTGGKAAVIVQTLTRGRWWLACCPQGAPVTNPTLRALASVNDTTVPMVNQADAAASGYQKDGVAGALPDPVVIGADNDAGPFVQMRKA